MNEMRVRAATEAELTDLIRGANGPLVVRGGGTRGVRVAGEILERKLKS